tara:strand:+ start:339 stop:479 length:141 start_codon:yes stop_codon:yes gene_type:complete
MSIRKAKISDLKAIIFLLKDDELAGKRESFLKINKQKYLSVFFRNP